MLATLLVVIVLQVISASTEPSTDPYRIHEPSGPYSISVHVPTDFQKILINEDDYGRLPSGECERGKVRYPCDYHPDNKIATLNLPAGIKVGWVGFKMYPKSPYQTGYMTVYFTEDGLWKEVDRRACIIPTLSSPGLIYAKHSSLVTVRCAKKRLCDTYALHISVDGIRKCEKGGTDVPACRRGEGIDGKHEFFELDILKEDIFLTDGKTYVYCDTEDTHLSFVIDWDKANPNTDPYRVYQSGGAYNISIPVPNNFEKLVIDDKDYLPYNNVVCMRDWAHGPPQLYTRCSYDAETKTATATIPNTRYVTWVGFKVYSAFHSGYQTVYFTQDGSWGNLKRHGCILPQYSSPSTIIVTDQVSVTIQCARKKICPLYDKNLVMLVEGTAKCQKKGGAIGANPQEHCKKVSTTHPEVEVYELEVQKPSTIINNGTTNVYCGTTTSQISFVIKWG